MKVLIIEDDKETADNIAKGLKKNGYDVKTAYTGDAGLHEAKFGNYDIAIIDRMLPKIDGLNILKSLRSENIYLPVLVLSALSDIDDRVTGIQSGADDYLAKPFAFTELLARIEALLRRDKYAEFKNIITIGNLKIDKSKKTASINDEVLQLKPQEIRLLVVLAENKNIILSKQMLLQKVWNYEFDPETNIVEVHISKLRNKIDKPFGTNYITTIRGKGYKLSENR